MRFEIFYNVVEVSRTKLHILEKKSYDFSRYAA